MNPLDPLLSAVGEWHGVNHLWLSQEDPPIESASTATVAAVLNGRFVRIDQTWAFDGKGQSGSLLVGFDPDAGVGSVHWIDTFHMGRKVLACSGRAAEATAIDVRGTYAAPPGPDWGWRIQINVDPAGRLVVLMHNVHPDGTEEVAVRAAHSRRA